MRKTCSVWMWVERGSRLNEPINSVVLSITAVLASRLLERIFQIFKCVLPDGLHVIHPIVLHGQYGFGGGEPSQADIQITGRLKSVLGLVDVRVLDHIVVTVDESVSLAQRGHL